MLVMKSLSIDNQEFVKAGELARELGYTSDYVGQLCRSKKVVAKLVGRTWYVDRNSLTEHKRNRYKKITTTQDSNAEYSTSVPLRISDKKTKTTKTKKQVDATAAPVAESSRKSNHFYTRVRQQPVTSNYDVDGSELIPLIKKTHKKLTVGLADANKVNISSHSKDSTAFKPTQRPVVQFKGSLTVADAEFLPEDPLPASEAKEELVPVKDTVDAGKAPAEEEQEEVQSSAVAVTVMDTKDRQAHIVRIDDQAVQVAPRAAVRRRKRGQTIVKSVETVHIAPLDEQSTTHHFTLVLSVVTAVFIAVVLLGLESHVHSSSTVVTSTVSFTIDSLLAAVYGYK